MFHHPDVFNEWIQILSHLTKPRQNAWIVGGYVRNILLSRLTQDIDITVSTDACELAQRFASKIKGAYVLLDQSHGCARVVKEIFETSFTIDFSDFRAKTLKADLGLRDFTINSLTVLIHKALTAENFKDHIQDFNGALKDLKDKRIKANAMRVFVDDPLRLLRAYSLSAQTGFSVEKATLKQIKNDKHLICQSAAERLREELFKIFQSPRAGKILQNLDKIGLLECVIPQICVMKNVQQGGYHHLDVWHHSLLVVEEFEGVIKEFESHAGIKLFLEEEIGGGHNRLGLIKFACLVHDIGKPQTKKHDGTRFTFHTHEHVGAQIVRHIAKQLKLTVKERYFLEDLVKLHLRPGYLSNFEKPSEKMIYRFMRDAQGEAVSVVLLAMADQRATLGPLSTSEKLQHHTLICQELIRRSFEPPTSKIIQKRLLSGQDLIKLLKLKPSPLFAKILVAVEEEKSLGKITTKEQALALAKKIAHAK